MQTVMSYIGQNFSITEYGCGNMTSRNGDCSEVYEVVSLEGDVYICKLLSSDAVSRVNPDYRKRFSKSFVRNKINNGY